MASILVTGSADGIGRAYDVDLQEALLTACAELAGARLPAAGPGGA